MRSPCRLTPWEYTAELLRPYGADRPGRDLRTWAAHWIPRLTKPLRHGGNHKYAWGLDRLTRRLLPVSLPYPKVTL